MAELFEDDGSLACLGIMKNDRDKRFACKEEQQSNLVNKTFWVVDYFAGTRYYLGIYETEAAAEMAYKTALAEWMESGRTPEPKKHLPDGMKHCSGCGKDLPKSRFYYLATYKRYSALCRDCHQAKMKEIRARKKETINP